MIVRHHVDRDVFEDVLGQNEGTPVRQDGADRPGHRPEAGCMKRLGFLICAFRPCRAGGQRAFVAGRGWRLGRFTPDQAAKEPLWLGDRLASKDTVLQLFADHGPGARPCVFELAPQVRESRLDFHGVDVGRHAAEVDSKIGV
ncbi:MAG: hypothetical protein F4051_12995 [Boseongicola sp. SB0670_bin_30]|nr:hypothetical protein [Boseongicola sp. SB0670_bin_30]